MGKPCSAACDTPFPPHPTLRTVSCSSACVKWLASSCSLWQLESSACPGYIVMLSASLLPFGKARTLPRPIVCQTGSENSCFTWTGTFSESLTGRLLLPGARCLKTGEKGSQESMSTNRNCDKTNPKLTRALHTPSSRPRELQKPPFFQKLSNALHVLMATTKSQLRGQIWG